MTTEQRTWREDLRALGETVLPEAGETKIERFYLVKGQSPVRGFSFAARIR
jgi:hypothetical protein